MMTATRVTRFGLGCAIVAALTIPATALAQPEQASPQQGQQPDAAQQSQNQDPQSEAQQAPQLKILNLEHRSPQEIINLLRRHGQGTYVAGFRGVSRGATETDGSELLVASDEAKKVLFLRGPADKIQEVDKLVEALDTPADQMQKHQFREMHLIPIPNGDATQINSILSQLRIDSELLSLGEARLILIRGGEGEDQDRASQLAQAEQVIARLTSPQPSGEQSSQQQSSQQQSSQQQSSQEQGSQPQDSQPQGSQPESQEE